MENNKKGNLAITILIIIVALIFISSLQKVEINDKQIKTATPSTCSLINKHYDPILHICIGTIKNDSQIT